MSPRSSNRRPFRRRRPSAREKAAVAIATLIVFTCAGNQAQATEFIGGGSEATSCQFPASVLIGTETSICAGTLIHPSIVLYAGQCGTHVSEILFGEKFDDETARIVTPDYCEIHPQSNDGSPAHDFAFCHLPYRINEIPHVPIAYGCELSQLTAGKKVYFSGYGTTNNPDETWGTKRIGELLYEQPFDGIIAAKNGAVGCPGDTGAGLLIELDDGSWRTVGVHSTSSYDCEPGKSTNYFGFAPDVVKWLEERSGEDVLPCFDGAGAWKPTPACRNQLASPLAGDAIPGSGTWDNWCSETTNSGYSTTCGPAANPDTLPPSAGVVQPVEGEKVTADRMVIEAFAADETALARVDLIIDTVVVASNRAPPFYWTVLNMPTGWHSVGVRAYDEDANVAEVLRTIEVVESEEDSSSGADDDDSCTCTEDSQEDGSQDDDASNGETVEDDDDDDDDDDEADGASSESAMAGCTAGTPPDALNCGLLFFLALRRMKRRRANQS
jgi:hypothetical protein